MTPRLDRRLALGLLWLAVGLAALRVAMLQGLLTTVRIDGGSMAEALLGEHVELACAHCAHHWRCDLLQWDATGHRVCPNCGKTIEESAVVSRRAGDRIVVDRAAYLLGGPQRFDVVAFAPPYDANELAAKRIVGLPEEQIEIRRGDVFIDGKLLRKSYAQFRATAVNVSTGERNWQPSNNESSERRLVFQPNSAAPVNAAATVNAKATALDFDPYNPALARELNRVVDVLGAVEIEGACEISLEIHEGYERFRFDLSEADRRVVLRSAKQELSRGNLPAAASRRVAWGTCDRQLWLVVDDRVVIDHRLEQRSEPPTADPEPLAVVSRGSDCRISSLRVDRDVYYLDDRGLGEPWSAPPLGPDDYFLLGDNPPLSIDSRHWERAIRRGDILGRVLKR